MKPVTLTALLVLTSGTAGAATIERACIGDGFAAPDACACMQQVADEYMDDADQALYVDYVQRRTSMVQIVASRGQSGAEAFVDRMTSFAADSQGRCGVP